MLEGEQFVSYSIDKCCKESRFMELPSELYNKVTPTGLPPHELRLKKVHSSVFRNMNFFRDAS